MKGKAEPNNTKELQFELKYCERCGGLWLRPVGGGQIYCKGCGREMAQLPPASKVPDTAQLPQGPRWDGDDGDFKGDEGDEGVDLDAMGGLV
jgi:Zn-finger nucleic acid-binding protein